MRHLLNWNPKRVADLLKYPGLSGISTSEKYEMDYWKEKFGVSSPQLSGPVRAVGNNAKDVEVLPEGKEG
ncbi:DUF3606 domain-containing protein [Flavobacterium sp.]|uniref:DUF3606 domain-containing protein n=1 Tax=Flavobacterium sp. TaxID=239 RepID=UPI004034F6B7